MTYCIKRLKHGYYKVYIDFNETDSKIMNILFDNQLRFLRKEKGLLSKYKIVILAEKI